jgi:hypothetical protein
MTSGHTSTPAVEQDETPSSTSSKEQRTGADIEPEPQRRGDEYTDEHRGSPHDGGRCG